MTIGSSFLIPFSPLMINLFFDVIKRPLVFTLFFFISSLVFLFSFIFLFPSPHHKPHRLSLSSTMSNKAILCIWRINNETHKLEVLLTQRRWARWGMGQLFFDFQENDFSDETVHLRWPFMTQEERDLLSGTAQELWDHPMIPCNWRLTPEMSPMFSTRFAFTSEITRSHDNHTSNAAPLAFTFPGGRPDREEDSQEAAIREFVEETEIDRQDILLDTVMEISDFGWGVSFFIGQLKDICQASQVPFWETDNTETSRCIWEAADQVRELLVQHNPDSDKNFSDLLIWDKALPILQELTSFALQ